MTTWRMRGCTHSRPSRRPFVVKKRQASRTPREVWMDQARKEWYTCTRISQATRAFEIRRLNRRISSGPCCAFDVEQSHHLSDAEQETLELLQWPDICRQVASFASTPFVKNKIRRLGIPIGSSHEESLLLMDQTEAAILVNKQMEKVGQRSVSQMLQLLEDISGTLHVIDGCYVIQANELAAIARTLITAEEISIALQENLPTSTKESLSFSIMSICPSLTDADRHLRDNIERCISLSGNFVKNDASDSLHQVRLRMKNLNMDLKEKMELIAREMYVTGAAETSKTSIRRGRLCIAVKASRHSELPGGSIILDRSSSGLTYYAEPVDLLPLNNELVELKFKETEILTEILTALSAEAVRCFASLRKVLQDLEALDLAFARAGHSSWLHAVKPDLVRLGNGDVVLDVQDALHPILAEDVLPVLPSNLRGGRSMQGPSPRPIALEVPGGTRAVVITGPNTGGKTACIKTAAVLSMMAKCGLYVPAAKNPKLAWFDKILADIGDSQSLEQNLSTFSGHVKKLINIMASSTGLSLVLLDELGSGTDPTEGAALATATIEKFKDIAALTFITTHHAELKNIALKDPSVINAAVEFDLQTLKPTYRVLWGTTGESMALEVARIVGLKQGILHQAEVLLQQTASTAERDTKNVYDSLDRQLTSSKAIKNQAKKVLSRASVLHGKLHKECERLDDRVAAFSAVAEREILAEENEMKDLIQSTLQEACDGTILVETALDILEEVADHASTMANDSLSRSNVLHQHKGWVPSLGEVVLVPKLGYISAVVREVSGTSCTIEAGPIRLAVSQEEVCPSVDDKGSFDDMDVEKVVAGSLVHDEQTRSDPQPTTGSQKDFPTVQLKGNTIDIRGKRADEAEIMLEEFLSRRGKGAAFIVHGVGTGKLLKAVHSFLRNHPLVEKYQEDKTSAGGCTIAYIK